MFVLFSELLVKNVGWFLPKIDPKLCRIFEQFWLFCPGYGSGKFDNWEPTCLYVVAMTQGYNQNVCLLYRRFPINFG